MNTEALAGWLRAELAGLLGADPARIGDDDRFAALGLDSLRATRLIDKLSTVVGERLSPTLLFAHPSIGELVRGLEHGATSATEPAVRRTVDEPIAVIGLACRFPGADNATEFWTMLQAGTDAVGPVPADRWPADRTVPGVPGHAGFLTGPVDGFDPLFFGISPREAQEMDPQQRLFLEVAWEALEDAGHANDTLAGSATGVFAGAIWHDYADLAGDNTRLTPHSATGGALNMVANRLSYALGLRGPSLTLDSACSSSLLAVHLACQSLRAGESDMALAGGVNLLLSDTTMVSLARFGGLSPDGRCKAFDASADGFGRGEGCGVVVLKPLSRALADGDRIWCLLKGSSANNDGFSNGLTAPNPLAQQDVLREACLRSGVAPSDIHFVETHGTGTMLGDPIEASALGAVLCAGRSPDRPLVIGSVKTNIGHLEGAAGIAGLIKTALCLRHGGIPANLHFDHPNPHIDFGTLGLRVPVRSEAWPDDRARLAGVSSFGWGGTNVHVVAEGWAEPAPLPELSPAGRVPAGHRVAFVCSPHGHQWIGMARRMLRTERVFRDVLVRCDRELGRYTGWSLLRELHAGDTDSDDVSVTQPILFAIEVALAAWLESRGVRPDAVAGHSLGEIGAAVIAGILDLPDAVRLVHHYSRHQRRVSGRGGGMAVVELAAGELAEFTTPATGLVIAARNGPRATALAGDIAELERMLAVLKQRDVLCAMIKVNVAAHSPAIDAVSADLIADVGELTPRPGRIPMISTVTGQAVDWRELDARYFARNLREPVALADATATLLARGHDVLVELSAHPVLEGALRQSVAAAGAPATVLGTMRRGDDDRDGVIDTLRELDRLGVVRPADGRTSELFTLSAVTPAALAGLATGIADAIDALPAAAPMADLAARAAERADHPYRMAVVARTGSELAATLRTHCQPPARVVGRPSVAFVFPGQGSQWLGMGRELLAREPVFAAAIRECDAAAARFVDWSILAELTADGNESRLDRIDVVQPVLFAMEVALARLWTSWGVRPDAVVGHSMGEVAAACVAGAVTVEDAARVVCLRSRLMRRASGQGAMLAVELTMAQARELVAGHQDTVSVAVSNSPRSTVLSGDRDVLTAIEAGLVAREVFCRWVKVDVASHSPQMDALRDDLLAALDGVSGRAPVTPMYSTVTGEPVRGTELDAVYWMRNLRLPVLFGDQIERMAAAGHTVFIEMSPHPILLPAVQQVAMHLDRGDITALPSLRRDQPERDALLGSLCTMYTLGADVDLARVNTPGRHGIALPTYPWQRERFWHEGGSRPRHTGGRPGERLDSAITPGTHYWQFDIDPDTISVRDHVIGGQAVLPGAAYADLVLRLAAELSDVDKFEVTGLRFHAPLVVDETGRRVQAVLVEGDPATVRFFDVTDAQPVCVAEATVSVTTAAPPPAPPPALPPRPLDGIAGADYYARLAAHGLEYGPAYQGIRRISVSETEAFAEIGLPGHPGGDHVVVPSLLDAAIQTALAPVLLPDQGTGLFISAGIDRIIVHKRLTADCAAHATVRAAADGFVADVTVYDSAGEPWVETTGVTILRLHHAGTAAETQAGAGTGGPGESRFAGPTAERHRDSPIVLATGAERRSAVAASIAECVAAVVKLPVSRIDSDQPLRSLGIDSVMSLELRNRLETRFGVTLSATVIWNYPTVRELTPLLAQRAGIPLTDETAGIPVVAGTPVVDGEALRAELAELAELAERMENI